MKISKVRSLVLGFTTAVLTLSFAGGALAQSQAMKADIPFDFYVGDKLLPAGVYTVTPKTNGVIHVGGTEQGTFMMTHPVNTRAANSALVFTRYGNLAFLTQLKWAGSGTRHEIVQSKLEKEVRSRTSPVQLAITPEQ